MSTPINIAARGYLSGQALCIATRGYLCQVVAVSGDVFIVVGIEMEQIEADLLSNSARINIADKNHKIDIITSKRVMRVTKL